MSTKNKFSYIAPIKKKLINSEAGPLTLKYISSIKEPSSEVKKEIENSPHLDDLLKLFDGKIHQRIIVMCENLNFGLSSVYKTSCCTINKIERAQAFDLDFNFDDTFSQTLEASLSQYESDNLEETNNSIEEDFYIMEESKFDLSTNNVGDSMKAMPSTHAIPTIDYSVFQNLIILADGLFPLTQKTIDFIQSFEGNIAIVCLYKNKNTTAIEQLLFENDFEIFMTYNPTITYLSQQFSKIVDENGYTLDTNLDVDYAISQLIKYRGEQFQEYDLYLYFQKNIKFAPIRKKQITSLINLIQQTVFAQTNHPLNSIVGLEDIKKQIQANVYKHVHLKQMETSGHTPSINYKHMAFEGNPGTCKTTMARAVAKLYQAQQLITNGFYEFGREDIVGRFVGETSQKVSHIFNMAKGGVLFIDEIGALLTGNSIDSFGEEALNSIVRHMENSPETMVIIATYPNEMKKILDINPGLESRLSSIIHFPDYTPEELMEIFFKFSSESGYNVEPSGQKTLIDYFKKIQNQSNFGNGREARKLFERTLTYHALSLLSQTSKKINLIKNTSIQKASLELLKYKAPSQRQIGFLSESEMI